MVAEQKLHDMGLELGPVGTPLANFLPAVRTGNLLFVAGHLAGKPDRCSRSIIKVKERNWEITAEEDISRNALPTIRMGFMIAERFLLPVKHFAYEKLRFKRAWLYHFTRDVRTFIDEKAEKELATIDPERFMKERRYMFYVVTKK